MSTHKWANDSLKKSDKISATAVASALVTYFLKQHFYTKNKKTKHMNEQTKDSTKQIVLIILLFCFIGLSLGFPCIEHIAQCHLMCWLIIIILWFNLKYFLFVFSLKLDRSVWIDFRELFSFVFFFSFCSFCCETRK